MKKLHKNFRKILTFFRKTAEDGLNPPVDSGTEPQLISVAGCTVQVNSLELERPHAHEMIREMQRQDDDSELCECGLPKEKSGLPRGWSIHLSQDDDTRGEVGSSELSVSILLYFAPAERPSSFIPILKELHE